LKIINKITLSKRILAKLVWPTDFFVTPKLVLVKKLIIFQAFDLSAEQAGEEIGHFGQTLINLDNYALQLQICPTLSILLGFIIFYT